MGGRSPGGYGHFNLPNKAGQVPAHRWAWAEVNGPIAKGMQLDHLCHSQDKTCPGGNSCPHRPCVRPDHLEPVKPRENVQRGRVPKLVHKTHCDQCGLELGTTYGGRRGCLPCARRKARENWRAKYRPAVGKVESRTECRNGHPHEGNTDYLPDGSRRCRICAANAQQRYRESGGRQRSPAATNQENGQLRDLLRQIRKQADLANPQGLGLRLLEMIDSSHLLD